MSDKQELVDRVIDQIKSDIDSNDWTSIEGLLSRIELGGFLIAHRVIDQIKSNIDSNDWTSIEGLLSRIEPELLRGFLSEQHF
mgnify:CR=1 FL=1